MDPKELMIKIRKDREELVAFFERLTEKEMIRRPGPQDDWSVKDLIAHITWWESYILERVNALLAGEPSEPSEPEDVLNAKSHRLQKHTPLGKVIKEFKDNWPKFENLLSKLNDEQLNQPAYYRTYDGIALFPILEAGTIGHYQRHIKNLQDYFQKVKQSRQGNSKIGNQIVLLKEVNCHPTIGFN